MPFNNGTEARVVPDMPLAARLYVAVMVALGALTLGSFARLPVGRSVEFVGLALAAILTSAFKLHLPTTKNRATLSVSFVIDFTSLLVLGAGPTLYIAGAGALAQSTVGVKRRNPLYRTLFNVACLAITMQATGWSYQALGGTSGRFSWPSNANALTVALIIYFVLNSLLIATAMALSTGQRIVRVWRENFLWGGPSYFIGAILAAVMAEVIGHQAWGLIPLGAMPVYVLFRTYGVYVGRLEDEHRHREVIESLNEGMAVVQHDGCVALWNDALERITGRAREDVLGRPLVEAVPMLAPTPVPTVIARVLSTGQPATIEQLTVSREDGSRTLQVRVFPFVGGVTAFWQDITERAEAEAALRQSEERYALAASGANDGLWDWDLVREVVYFSPRWRSMLGLGPDDNSGRPGDWFRRVHSDDLTSLNEALEAHLAGETAHFQHEHRIRHEDGTYRWMLCRGVAVRRPNGKATRIAGSQTDVTERVSAQDQLRQAALHDTLTALPNRALFMELLGQVLDRRKRHPEDLCAVLFLDIDRFKVVNDSLGHLVGDELLIGISRRLESCLRQGDVLARMGGDEFTILLNDLSKPSDANLISERIQEALRAPFSVGGRELFTTASIGIALSGPHYTRPEDIMRDADTAMYRAKALGKARHELFDAGMHAKAIDRLGFEHDLRGAFERREFALHYQPIVSLASGRWTGFEALLRWNRGGHPVSPSEFIPVAEETGIIEPLGTWVLQEACRQAAVWRRQFPKGTFNGITVNVSPRQLARPDFLQVVQEALAAAALEPGDLRLEITETVLMDDPARAEVVLGELRRLGVKIYLDDFGTGFSSLSYLHRFPVDTLKIDRSFVASLKEGSERPAIIESIVTLARMLGTHVIAEGVETERQMHELTRLGCTEAQGYFFAQPLPASTAESLLAGPPAFAA
jgi:diguanylate cyclase (GGDEF)-like protein/PAS domain S-box-containing protein